MKVNRSSSPGSKPRINDAARAAAAHRHTDAGPDQIVCLLCGETYRAITYPHLKWVHGFEGAHPVLDYRARFGLRVACCEEVCERAKEVQITRHKRAGRHWTEARILREIRSRSGTEHGLAHSRVPIALSLVAARRFGSWEAAVRRAGVDPVPHRLARGWDRERVVSEAHRLSRGRDRLSSLVAKRVAPKLYRAAIQHFRSWTATLKAAGLDTALHREPSRWSGDRVSAWVRTTHAAGGDIRSSAAPSGAVMRATRETGRRWSEYIDSLGIPYPGQRKRFDWSDGAVLAAIRQRRRHGVPLNAKAVVRESGQALVLQARRRFGSWDGALRAAGLRPESIRLSRAWSRMDVIDAIRARHAAGESLRRKDVVEADRRLVKAAQRQFPSSWIRAVAAAGVDLSEPRRTGVGRRRVRRRR